MRTIPAPARESVSANCCERNRVTNKQSARPYYAQSIDEAAKVLRTDLQEGLAEDEVRRRLDRYGPNKLREAKKQSAWKILLGQFRSMVIIVLVIAGTAALAFGHGAEAMAIAAVLLVNAAIGFGTEWKAVRSMEALKAMGGDTIRVRRGGGEMEVDAEVLVPGDVVVVEGGDLAPADVRLTESNSLRVNEAALTGESVPVRKTTETVRAEAPLADRTCMIYKGTTLTEGSGEGIVVATGMKTQLGRISSLAESAEKVATPLQKRLDRLGRRLAWITLTMAVVIAAVGLLAGQDPRRMIETAIALGVAAIPEGLPIVATIALARGMQLMARRNALIKRLPAVETLGATRVIFTDKTGTLTENRMTLRHVSTPNGDFELEEEGDGKIRGPGDAEPPALRRVLEVGVLCNNAALQDTDGDREPGEDQGDPTETALLRGGLMFGMERPALLEKKPELREVPFDAETMMMATYHRGEDGVEVAVKGAPSRVLEACDCEAENGREDGRALDSERRGQWLARAGELAGEGLRVLAMADKVVSEEKEEPYKALRFLGLVGLLDPPRGDVRAAIEQCQAAGIRVVMVTGDQAATAAAIATQTGVVGGDAPRVIQGSEIKDPAAMSDEDRRRFMETEVFARVSPEQKLRLITLMQEEGLTVAMTGDGVNDAPALKKADIGVAMGRRGTDAAREVADMVLRDDAFSTIVEAVRHGRIIFGNIRKSVMFMLCTNVAEVIAVAAAAVAGGFSTLPIPLLPLQILFLNVVSDVFPALALGMGAGEPTVMTKEPRPRWESVLTRSHWLDVGGWAVLMSACVLCALALAFYSLGFDQKRAVTVSFLTLAFAKLWFVFNLRNPGTRMFNNEVVKNPFIIASIVLCVMLLACAVYVPGLSGLLRTSEPGWHGWLLILAMSLIPFLWGQGRRIMQAAGYRGQESPQRA